MTSMWGIMGSFNKHNRLNLGQCSKHNRGKNEFIICQGLVCTQYEENKPQKVHLKAIRYSINWYSFEENKLQKVHLKAETQTACLHN